MAKKKKREFKTRMPMGRPPKFLPEYCDKLLEHMSDGGSFESFSAVVKVHRDTLYEWASVHEAFSDAKKRGFDASLMFYEKMAKAGMIGQLRRVTSETTTTGLDGKPVTKRTYAAAVFNSTAWIFLMKNMHRWRDRVEVRTPLDDRLDNLAEMSLEELEAEANRVHDEIRRAVKR